MKFRLAILMAILIAIAAYGEVVHVFGTKEGEPRCVPIRQDAEKGLAFQEGEKLVFKIRYKWGAVNAYIGTAQLMLDTTVYNGVEAYHCKLRGRTAHFYDPFFKVREDFQSWFSKDGLLPLRFTRKTREGNYNCRNEFIFSWEGGDEHINANIYTSKKGYYSAILPLTTCTYDIPALFYVARNLDFSKVKENVQYPLTFAIDDDIYTIHFVWKGTEALKLKGLGTIMTMKFTASVISGEIFTGEEHLTLWISDDDNRIPVYAEAPIRVGRIYARLSEFYGLKHEFSSMIK